MKKYILSRVSMSLLVMLIAGSWLTGCGPSGTSQTDQSQDSQSINELTVSQYPLSVSRALSESEMEEAQLKLSISN
jgi:hypothetical protein